MSSSFVARPIDDWPEYFENQQAYEAFLEKLSGQLNAERQERFKEEQTFLGPEKLSYLGSVECRGMELGN